MRKIYFFPKKFSGIVMSVLYVKMENYKKEKNSLLFPLR